MPSKNTIRWISIFIILAISFIPVFPPLTVQAYQPAAPAHDDVTAYDLILAMNTLRASYGHGALIEDPIIDAVAQSTAEIMAANEMSWHIGDVKGRLAAAGYGNGATVWATENFAAGATFSIDEIMVVWSDADHMLPATNGNYCNVGAGVAKSPNGLTYYVLQAAYASGKSCGSYTSPGGSSNNSDGENSSDNGASSGVPPYIVPVKIATPDADGKIYHVVEAGQSFWSIAIAYQITIHDLEVWNNTTRNSRLQIGEKLFIPGPNTVGYSTPTPPGMVITSTPDADGKVIHEVAAYQTLSTISQAYGVSVETLLALNGLQLDWPLQIGQKLVVKPSQVTPSPTPRPLTPLEKLTPAADGKYYHSVLAGESLSWIAGLYKVSLNDLMAWNGMNAGSILHVGDKLVLQVTPPATQTPTPGPATHTPTLTPTPPATATATLPPPSPTPTATAQPSILEGGSPVIWIASVGLFTAVGLFLFSFLSRKKRE